MADTALAGSSSAVSGVSGVLTTQIRLAGLVESQTTAQGILAAGFIVLIGSCQATSNALGSVTTGIALRATCQSVSDVYSQLRGQIAVVRAVRLGSSYEAIFGNTPRYTYKNNDKLGRTPY